VLPHASTKHYTVK